MKATRLVVLVGGAVVGSVEQGSGGALSFSYDSDYQGPVPLSLSMPISARRYGDKIVRPYLLGLLPDSPEVKSRVAREFGVSGMNPFALLAHIGLDCPGAVQLCLEEDVALAKGGKESLVPISEEEIAVRLEAIESGSSWSSENEHWSLGGNQAKLALRFDGKSWSRCLGASATTHIIKPGIPSLRLQSLDEFASMRLAALCGLPVAACSFHSFAGHQAVVVRRYDRVMGADGGVRRIHQEDFCQALAVAPDKKYASDGGPSTPDVLRLLRMTSEPEENTRTFAAMLFFNYLIGGSDAHAKNYSLLLEPDGSSWVAPLYDVASALPYDFPDRREWRVAMSIGGENRIGRVGAGAIRRFASQSRLPERSCLDLMANLADAICRNIDGPFSEIGHSAAADELAERFVPRVREHCRHTLDQL
jgi:serine/threonine-protein kinase HipA